MSVDAGYFFPLLLIILCWIGGSICEANEIVISSRSYEPRYVDKIRYPRKTGYRVAKGHTSLQGQFPAYVRVRIGFIKNSLSARFAYCGGTILNPREIISAAHCFDKPEIFSIKVYPGIVNDNQAQSYHVDTVCISKLYTDGNPDRFDNLREKPTYDIAILNLNSSITFNRFVGPAFLPDEPMNGTGFVIGMGETGNHKPSKFLQYTRAKVVQCELWARHPSIMCIERVDSTDGRICSGDSGGAFYISDGESLRPVGAVSFDRARKCQADDSRTYLADYYSTRFLIEEMLDTCDGHRVLYKMNSD